MEFWSAGVLDFYSSLRNRGNLKENTKPAALEGILRRQNSKSQAPNSK
jgi:hypothetical protein